MFKKQQPATPEEIKAVQFAYDTMEKGVLYSLYIGDELIPYVKYQKIFRNGSGIRISPNTKKAFICQAYFCSECGKFFVGKKKQLPTCNVCVKDRHRVRLNKESRDETKAKYTTKGNKKNILRKKAAKPVSCSGCAKLYLRHSCFSCESDDCVSENYRDRVEGVG